KGPPFHFQSRPAHRPDYLVFRRRETPISSSSPPLVGYVQYSKINQDRLLYLKKHGTGRAINATPTRWTVDPYFLCHLLALAQLQEQMLVSTSPKSRLIITNVLDSKYIYIYEAQIPRGLLNGLRGLKTAMYPITWPVIRRTKIPF
ncbi:hypothetical protein N7481_011567, partial [Penicillium waksmanii]|uniref:uncharacterized protein n=1 Tax=Penicillium waksmanii TaxID=69791 RepID=UPI00254673C3